MGWPRAAPPHSVAFRGQIPIIQGQNSLRAHETAVPCSSQPHTQPDIWETEARHSKQGCQGLASSSQHFSAWSGSGRAHLSVSLLLLRGACASSFIHLFCTGNPENPQISPCIKGRGCSDWDGGVSPPGCARPQCQVFCPQEGSWASTGLKQPEWGSVPLNGTWAPWGAPTDTSGSL